MIHTRVGYLTIAIGVAGCTGPDLTPEVANFGQLVTTATEPLDAALEVDALAEAAAARSNAIAQGLPIYQQPTGCLDISLDIEAADLADCQAELTESATAQAAPGTATLSQQMANALQDYADALVILATSDVSADVGNATGNFLTSLSELSATVAPDSVLSSKIAAVAPSFSRLATQANLARRNSVLRQIIVESEEAMDEIISRLIAERAPQDGLVAAAEALGPIYSAMEDAMGTPGYEAAVVRFEQEMTAFQALARQSHAGRLMLIRQAHIALADHARQPGDIDSLITLLDELNALKVAIQ